SSGSTTQLARDAQALGSRTLRVGAKGKQVRVLQRVLTVIGYRVRVTGYFGALTRAQVLRFQRNWTLPVVGYMGPAPAGALRGGLLRGGPHDRHPVRLLLRAPAQLVRGAGGPDRVHGPARRLRRRDRRRGRLPPALRAVGRCMVERRAHDRPAAVPEGLGQVA